MEEEPNVEFIGSRKGKLVYPDKFEEKQFRTVALVLPGSMSKKAFIERYMHLLPNDANYYFFPNPIQFDPKTKVGHVPDKLIKDVTQEMKGGGHMDDAGAETKNLSAKHDGRKSSVEKTIMLDGKLHVRVGGNGKNIDYWQAAEDVRKPKHRRPMCPKCSKFVNERGICECW